MALRTMWKVIYTVAKDYPYPHSEAITGRNTNLKGKYQIISTMKKRTFLLWKFFSPSPPNEKGFVVPYYLIFMLTLITSSLCATENSLVWTTPSHNSSESMPCGGGDIGLNVWVENGDLLLYVSQSGTFDENNTMLKQGRFRLHLTPNPFMNVSDLRQELKMNDGSIEISAGGTTLQVWVDVFHPLVHIDIQSKTS